MTISSSSRQAGPFDGNGVTTAFPFAYKVFSASEVRIVKTSTAGVESDLVIGVNPTVSLNANQDVNPGGSVTYTTLATGEKLTIIGNTADTQPTDITPGSKFFAQIIENALDRCMMVIQQFKNRLSRAITVPVSDNPSLNNQLPTAVNRANKLLSFDSSGQPVAITPDAQSGTALLILLASSVGSSLIGFIQSGLGAVLRTVQDKLRDSIGISIKDFGAVCDGVTDDSAAWALAKTYAASVKRPLYLPNGMHLVSAQVFNDLRIGIIGESTLGTIIKAPAGFTGTLIKMLNTTNNGGDTFERIEKLTIQGDYGVGSVGVDQALCSRSVMRDVRVQGFDVGVRRVNSFCMLDENVEINDCRIDLHLVGSNHASEHVRCSYVGAGSSWGGTGQSVLITNSGADGLQSSLAFRGCDVEFGGTAGDGFVATMTGTLELDNCYGESLGGTLIKINDGHCEVIAGEWIIKDSTGYLCDVVGANASITFSNRAAVTSDGVTRTYSSLIKSSGAGSVVFASSTVFTNLLTTNVGSLPPLLGRQILAPTFLKPAGRSFGWNPFTGNGTRVDTGDTIRVTCTVAGNLGVYQQMTAQPFINRNCLLLIRYRSNTSFSVTVDAGGGQAAPVTTLATLPNSSGVLLVFVIPVAKITAATQTWLEFWKGAGWAVNDYLELEEVTFIDGGSIPNGVLSF